MENKPESRKPALIEDDLERYKMFEDNKTMIFHLPLNMEFLIDTNREFLLERYEDVTAAWQSDLDYFVVTIEKKQGRKTLQTLLG